MKQAIVFLFFLLLTGLLYGQEKREYKIGVLTDTVTVELAPMIQGLMNEVRAVVGEDAVITFPVDFRRSNGFNPNRAKSQYEALVEEQADIIIAFGAVNNEVISSRAVYEIPTILFGTLNLDLVDIDANKQTSGIDNFTYLISPQSYREDLLTFQSLFDFQNVGILIDSNRYEVFAIQAALGKIFDELGKLYTLLPYTSTDDLAPLLGQIDAVYVAEGFYMPSEDTRALADYLIENNLPSFTSYSAQDVELGIMARYQSNENVGQYFRRIALYVEAVVNGANLSDLPLYVESNRRLNLNMSTAKAVGVSPRYGLIATTDFVGGFENRNTENSYSLIDVIDDVLNRNLVLRISRKELELANQDVRGAKAAYLPGVTASATGSYLDRETAAFSNGQNPEYSTDGNLTLTQTIFSDAANANVEIKKSLAKAELANLEATELDLVLNAANAYFNVLILKTNLQIRNENLSLTRRNLQVAEQNFEGGQSGRSDVLRLQSEMAQNMQALVESVNQLQQGFLALNQLLNNPLDHDIDVEQAIISEGIFENYRYDQLQELLDSPSTKKVFEDYLVQEAIRNSPELKSLNYNEEVIKRNILLNNSRRFLPTVGAQAQYNRNFEQWGVGVAAPEFTLKDNFSIGLSLFVPLIDQNLKNIRRQTAIIQQEQLMISYENTAVTIEKNVKDAILNLVNQIANIELSNVSREAAEGGLELAQAAYSNGAVNIVQLLDAQNNYLQAQLAQANANYNYLLAAIILERYMGYFFLLHTEEENQTFINRFQDFRNDILNN